MKKVMISIIAWCFCLCNYGQEIIVDFHEEVIRHEYSIADMDGDYVIDSFYYNTQNDSIMFSLSTHHFRPFGLKYEVKENTSIRLMATLGGFTISSIHELETRTEHYKYDVNLNKFRLIFLRHEQKENKEETLYSLDLLTGKYKISLSRYDVEADSMFVYSDVSKIINQSPIYWEESNFDLQNKLLFRESQEYLILEEADI